VQAARDMVVIALSLEISQAAQVSIDLAGAGQHPDPAGPTSGMLQGFTSLNHWSHASDQ